MKTRNSGARSRSCERLEDRRMLAADLGVELFSFVDGETETIEVSTMENSQSSVEDIARMESTSSTDVVLDWNNLFNELLVADEVTQNPGYASRAMAMLNLAIYDSVSIATGNPQDTFYDYSLQLGPNARIKAEIAASEAAYTVLSGLYPDQQVTIDAFYESIMAGYRQKKVTADSLAVGAEIGNTILAERANDGSDAVVDYTYTDEIGYFQADPLHPDVPVWGPGWGEVDTFAISSAESFAPETTPALTSKEYAASYNEVLELGSVDSTVRTADQTEAGIFWAYDHEGLGTPMALFGDVLESIATEQGNTMEENAALFAQASVAMADAGIVAWHTKFDEEFWRPVTAIHDGDIDGNPLTAGDADWTALGAPDGGDDIVGFTPQFPTYVSGHATFGGALFGAIQEFYGTDDISFTVSSQELEILLKNPDLQEAYGLDLDDAQRSFDTLSEAMAENGRSRVYLGIHFDFDDLVGQEVGQAVASTVSSEFVVAANDGNPRNIGGGPRRDGGMGDNNGRHRGPQRPPRANFMPDAPRDMIGGINGATQPPSEQASDRPRDMVRPKERMQVDQTANAINDPPVVERDAVPAQADVDTGNLPDENSARQSEQLRQSLARSRKDAVTIEDVDGAFSDLGESRLAASLDQPIDTHRHRGRG